MTRDSWLLLLLKPEVGIEPTVFPLPWECFAPKLLRLTVKIYPETKSSDLPTDRRNYNGTEQLIINTNFYESTSELGASNLDFVSEYSI